MSCTEAVPAGFSTVRAAVGDGEHRSDVLHAGQRSRVLARLRVHQSETHHRSRSHGPPTLARVTQPADTKLGGLRFDCTPEAIKAKREVARRT